MILRVTCAFIVVSVGAMPLAGAEPADLLLINGNIHTLHEAQPSAQAVAVKGDRILFAGSTAGAKMFQDDRTRLVDLQGKTVVPGLIDSHCHIFGVGAREMTLNLEGTNSLADFLAKVKERVEQTERGKWVTGRGWIETFWKPAQFPTRGDLDMISPENPVFLTRADGHAGIANRAALTLAGIDKDTPNPFGGEILKDAQTGEPTGMLIDHAQDLIEKHIPPPTEAESGKAFLLGVKREIELGWCGIQNAGSNREDLMAMHRAFQTGKVKLRIYNAVYDGMAASTLFREGIIVNNYRARFTQRTLKLLLDGALGSRGAALLKPYADAETSGLLRRKPEELGKTLELALRRGVQVATHAIGDRANRLVLDLYEEAFRAVPPEQRKIREPRWRIEHAQIVDPLDVPRFKKLGVIPSMQPSHAISDLFFAPKRLGMERLAQAYSWKSFLDSGAIIAGGSDAPVERGEPMIEFYAAVTRKSIKGESLDGWHPEQAVAREQALKMFTIWAAYAAFEESEKGSIEVGKLADFTVLSKDIMKIPAPEILQTKCVMTIIGGEIVFEATQ